MLNMRPLRFGVAVDGAKTREGWIELARSVEDQGYGSLLVPDHFVTEFAVIPALQAAADATTSLRVGSLVFDNDFRHPVLLAREVATLDLLAGGRVEFGIGAGWHQQEYAQTGIAFERAGMRIGRLEESLQIIKQFFTQETVNFAGNYYKVSELKALPRPVQRPYPPLLMGGGGKKLLTLAAREADIIGLHFRIRDTGGVDIAEHREETLARKVGWVREAAGERFASIELNLLLSKVEITQNWRQATERYIRDWELEGVSPEQVVASPYVLIGSLEQLVERVQELRERFGISYFIARSDDVEAFAPIVARLAGA